MPQAAAELETDVRVQSVYRRATMCAEHAPGSAGRYRLKSNHTSEESAHMKEVSSGDVLGMLSLKLVRLR